MNFHKESTPCIALISRNRILPITQGAVSLVAQMVKKLPAMRGPGFNLWVGKFPWRREWHHTPVFLLGEFHGQRNLVANNWTQLSDFHLSFHFFSLTLPRGQSY